MPHIESLRRSPIRRSPMVRHSRIHWVFVGLISLSSPIGLTGCSSLWQGTGDESEQSKALQELMQAPEPPELIRDATAPHGTQPIEVEGVGVVNGLPSTGGPPIRHVFATNCSTR